MKLHRVFLLIAIFLVFSADAGLSAPGDIPLKRDTESTAYKAAVFPHWVHVIRYRCYNCHPTPFKMVKFKLEKGSLKQDRGPYRAKGKKEETESIPDTAKNDGKKKAPATNADAGKLNLPAVPVIAVEKVGEALEKTPPPENKPVKPEPITNAADATEEKVVMHGEQACGMCHDGKTAFLVEFKSCGKCHSK